MPIPIFPPLLSPPGKGSAAPTGRVGTSSGVGTGVITVGRLVGLATGLRVLVLGLSLGAGENVPKIGGVLVEVGAGEKVNPDGKGVLAGLTTGLRVVVLGLLVGAGENVPKIVGAGEKVSTNGKGGLAGLITGSREVVSDLSVGAGENVPKTGVIEVGAGEKVKTEGKGVFSVGFIGAGENVDWGGVVSVGTGDADGNWVVEVGFNVNVSNAVVGSSVTVGTGELEGVGVRNKSSVVSGSTLQANDEESDSRQEAGGLPERVQMPCRIKLSKAATSV
jgi:hypothetical protein